MIKSETVIIYLVMCISFSALGSWKDTGSAEYDDIFTFLDRNEQEQAILLIKKRPCDASQTDRHGRTPLHTACQEAMCLFAHELLKNDEYVDYTAIDAYGRTPLHILCAKEYTCEKECWILLGYHYWMGFCQSLSKKLSQKAMVKVLCTKMAAKQLNIQDNDGNTPLHYAVQYRNDQLVEELLNCKPSCNICNNLGFTPLHLAAYNDSLSLCRDLLRHGADVNAQGKQPESTKLTPLHIACERGSLDVTIFLLSKDARLDVVTDSGDTPMHSACKHDNESIIRELIKNGADIEAINGDKETPLHVACKAMSEDNCSVLIEEGVELNKKNRSNETPLHLATATNSTDICKLLLTQQQQCEVNAQDSHERTPLYHAVLKGNIKVCDLLISANADVNVKDEKGRGLLHCAVDRQDAYLCSYLLNKGTKINLEDDSGVTPFMVACSKECKIVRSEFLDNKNLALKRWDDMGRTCLFYGCEAGRYALCRKLVEDHGCNPQRTMEDGSTLLHISIQTRNCKLISWLISIVSNPSAQNKEGETAFHVACSLGDSDVLNTLLDAIKYSDIGTKQGQTAMHYAAKNNRYQLIAPLCRHGAKVDVVDKNGDTPLALASSLGYIPTVQALCKRKAVPDEIIISRSQEAGHEAVVKFLSELSTPRQPRSSHSTDLLPNIHDGYQVLPKLETLQSPRTQERKLSISE